jgi:hypothetical protein
MLTVGFRIIIVIVRTGDLPELRRMGGWSIKQLVAEWIDTQFRPWRSSISMKETT